jgi:Ferric reductase like transmembrane component/FAD-binding domain
MSYLPISSSLRDALKLFHEAISSTSSHDTSSIADGNVSTTSVAEDSFRKRILERYTYSRVLVPTYQYVLLGLLATITVLHWTTKIRRAVRRRQWKRLADAERILESQGRLGHIEERGDITPPKPEENTVEESTSSSGSTSSSTTGIPTPTENAMKALGHPATETSPLLSKSAIQSSSYLPSLYSRVRYFLLYQPAPIPLVDKVLPSNGTSIFIVLFLGLNIFYTLFAIAPIAENIFVFADRASLMFISNLPLLYLLAAKNQPVKFLTGYSYESLNLFHRRIGEFMCLLAILHGIGMFGVWWTIFYPHGVTLLDFLTTKIIVLGIATLLAYEGLYLTSLASFRKRWYELFLGLHVTLQLAAGILLWFHHHESQIYIGTALAIWVIDRTLFRLFLQTYSAKAAEVEVLEDGETVRIVTQIPFKFPGTGRSAAGIRRGWKATDHIFVTIPSFGVAHALQAHPFTISSPAPLPGSTSGHLELLIRAQDGFSKCLLTAAHRHRKLDIRCDGPYGSQTAVEMLQDSDAAFVVAGGSGIAVGLPLVWTLLDREEYDPEQGLQQDLGHRRPRNVFLLWIIHQQAHKCWLSDEEVKKLKAKGVHVEIYVTSESGRPDIGSYIEDHVKELELRGEKGSIGVVCSGPDGLNRAVRNTAAHLVRSGRDVDIEIEKFGW